MIFLLFKGGIYQYPLEYSSDVVLAIGGNILLGTVLQVLKK
jgi:hypothetical protein